jgi:hypothetical protein
MVHRAIARSGGVRKSTSQRGEADIAGLRRHRSAKENEMNDSLNRPVVPAGIDLQDTLPEHERRDDRTVGGGLMDQGGTAIDRGTGTLGDKAQGPVEDDDQDDPLDPEDVDTEEVQPNPQMQN